MLEIHCNAVRTGYQWTKGFLLSGLYQGLWFGTLGLLGLIGQSKVEQSDQVLGVSWRTPKNLVRVSRILVSTIPVSDEWLIRQVIWIFGLA